MVQTAMFGGSVACTHLGRVDEPPALVQKFDRRRDERRATRGRSAARSEANFWHWHATAAQRNAAFEDWLWAGGPV